MLEARQLGRADVEIESVARARLTSKSTQLHFPRAPQSTPSRWLDRGADWVVVSTVLRDAARQLDHRALQGGPVCPVAGQ
jgi:hypothetical protein